MRKILKLVAVLMFKIINKQYLFYRAVKLRKINTDIHIPVLNEHASISTAKSLNIMSDRGTTFLDERPSTYKPKKNFGVRPILPGLDITIIPLKITEVIDPGHFWAQMIDEDSSRKLDRILARVNSQEGLLLPIGKSLPNFDTIVFAPLSNQDNRYHRAMIQSYTMEKNIHVANVLYVDCGKIGMVQVKDVRLLRQFDHHDEELIKEFDLPALAFECVLANIRPTYMSSITGHWSKEARREFDLLLRHDQLQRPKYIFGEVFSVVNSVVALILHCKKGMGENFKAMNVNDYLIEKRYAEFKEEDYLSRVNHELRGSYNDMASNQRAFYEEAQYDPCSSTEIYPDPPNERDCPIKVWLRGPFSPLEIELVHLPNAGTAKRVSY